MREQMNKKKEWWEEEGLGSESEEDNEKDIGKHIRNRFQQNVTDFRVFPCFWSPSKPLFDVFTQ